MSSKVFFQSVIVNFWRLEQRAPSGFGVLPSTSQGWLERPGSLTQLRGMRYNIETSEILSWIVMVALIIAYTKQAQRYIPTCCRNSPGLMLTLALALFIYHEILILDVASQENQRCKWCNLRKKSLLVRLSPRASHQKGYPERDLSEAMFWNGTKNAEK